MSDAGESDLAAEGVRMQSPPSQLPPLSSSASFVVVGGGIAGVSCARALSEQRPGARVVLVTATPTVKTIVNVSRITKLLTNFDVEEEDAAELASHHSGLSVVRAMATDIDPERRTVTCDLQRGEHVSKMTISYEKLCLCNGARPKLIRQRHPFIIGIRDTESVEHLRSRLVGSKRIVIVGNGGIATELVHRLEGVEVAWVIKDDTITTAFVDPGAGAFLIDRLNRATASGVDVSSPAPSSPPTKRFKCTSVGAGAHKSDVLGVALGPDWHACLLPISATNKKVSVEFECEVSQVLTRDELSSSEHARDNAENETGGGWNVYVALTNGKVIGCDFVVSATGVMPNGGAFKARNGGGGGDGDGEYLFELAASGAIKVDGNMRTNLAHVFAAGDVCEVDWGVERPVHWFQMRLWTQARHMGMFAAQCMISALDGDGNIELDFCFQMFSHVTTFFGLKVVLLGLFNGQGLDGVGCEALLRVTMGREYVKAVMKEGKMQGAVLIGETDLEETFENLILNQLDLSAFGEDLLDPNVDIEDYFD